MALLCIYRENVGVSFIYYVVISHIVTINPGTSKMTLLRAEAYLYMRHVACSETKY